MSQVNSLSVVSSFKQKRVFITGVTGFLGKAILEKILSETPEVEQVYLLVRGNRQYTAHERCMRDVFDSSLFDVLRDKHGAGFQALIDKKVTVVAGELTDTLFGLPEAEFNQLAQSLDLIINSAASVNFREAMDQALKINTLSLNNVVALTQRKTQGEPVKVLQISTCYVNGFNRGVMREEVVSPASGLIPRKDDDTYEIDGVINLLNEKIERIYQQHTQQDKQQAKLVQLGIQQSQRYGWNDTYTFTKWLGEQLLIQALGKQNLTILRPSIIESAVSSPLPGWVEGVKVADALIYAYAKGRVSIFPGEDSGILDVIPVDLVANSALMCSAQLFQQSSHYRIYQCCSGRLNPIRLKQFIDYVQQASLLQYKQLPKLFAKKPQDTFKTVSPKTFRLYMMALMGSTWVKTILGRLFGSKSAGRMMEKANTTASLAMIFGFYTAPKYRFDSMQLEQLQARFSVIEQKQFNVKADSFSWKVYLQQIHLAGLHKYALAGKPDLTQKAAQKQKQAA
ncbi:MAG: SDR family oxidoreductase [Gammaproteobacteria bacterium]|nr:SDR family oxidoreductase [Gammaproteobacteria bacterium]